MVVANILDPVHDTLDPTVWDAVTDVAPVLKPQHKSWILDTILDTLKKHGYGDMDKWLEVYLTGSLTTYQYSDESDADVSLFVNTDVFPEWSRAEMVGIMVDEVDGTTLPGTTHPMQVFVVAKGIRPEHLYKPGLRSGYYIERDQWVVPPERSRIHDVQKDQAADYQYALECADKMERLLRYEPDKALQYWHQIHTRRRRDHQLGKGDFSQSNIIYKFLSNRGLFPKISEMSGEYIAKVAGAPAPWTPDPNALEQAARHLGLSHPVYVNQVQGTSGRYQGLDADGHKIDVVSWLRPESASKQIWHEMTHALQLERDPHGFQQGMGGYWEAYDKGHEDYLNHPWEVEARQNADAHPFSLVHGHKVAMDKPRAILTDFRPNATHPKGPNGNELPFIYDPVDNIVHVGPANSYHWELARRAKELKGKYNPDNPNERSDETKYHLHGRVEWPGKVTHFFLTDHNRQHMDAVNLALGATSGPEHQQQDETGGWEQMFSHTTEGQNEPKEAEEQPVIATSAPQGSVR